MFQFSSPKAATWWVAVVVGVIGLILQLGIVAGLGMYGFWLVFIAFALLAVACIANGL